MEVGQPKWNLAIMSRLLAGIIAAAGEMPVLRVYCR
jgi:hypothetical protein